jgi:hypothetical protein
MLVLWICRVPLDAILVDYMRSAEAMQPWGESPGDSHVLPIDISSINSDLRTPAVLSVEREYMEVAVRHIESRYFSVEGYLESCGVGADVLQRMRENLMVHLPGDGGTGDAHRMGQ